LYFKKKEIAYNTAKVPRPYNNGLPETALKYRPEDEQT
jgi:hypothetical protein